MGGDSAVSERTALYALAAIIFALLGWVGVFQNARIGSIEIANQAQEGRILLLEKQATLNRSDIDKIAVTLERINTTLLQISYEHKDIESRLQKVR